MSGLGHAEVRGGGVVLRVPSLPPAATDRGDELCVAVLWLAEQQGLIGFRRQDGSLPAPRGFGTWVVVSRGEPSPPPDIGAWVQPARAADDLRPALARLHSGWDAPG